MTIGFARSKETNKMSEIRRGSAAIQEAAEGGPSGEGQFRPYLPALFWKEDQQERYVLFLNEVEDMPLFDMIQFIPEGDYFQEAVSKTDQFFGERYDAFEKEWDATARKTNIAIAVELEPVVEIVNKRRKPRGFEVKTVEYERTVFDDDGEKTDEKEEVTCPAVGYIAQSPNNFFNQISNYDANEAPVTETALKITRIGKDKSTTYQIVGYDELPIDLSNLIGYVDGISYLGEDLDPLLDEIEKLTPEEAALAIGKKLLDKREEELIDDDRYQELFDGVTESMDKFGNKKKSKEKTKAEPVRSRAASRRVTKAEESDGDEPDEPTSDPEPTEEVTPAPKAAKKAASVKQTPESRMAELRKKSAERAAARK